MSSSEAPFHLRAVLYGSDVPDAQITVLDGFDRPVAEGGPEISLSLPRGLYTARVERAGRIEERVLRHDLAGTDEVMAAPERSSSVPSFDTATTHEYYAYTSADWSLKDTRPAIGLATPVGAPGRFFLFLRTPRAEEFHGEDLAEGLSLRDQAGNVLSRFEPGETERSADGWLALSARAAPGFYLLQRAGERRRDVALHVLPGWSTQVFVTYDHGPRFETAVVLLPRLDRSFDPDDRLAQGIDTALAGLQQGRNDLPRELVAILLEEKFNDLMLGLVGGHLELLKPEADRALLDVVLRNLERLAPGAPDVAALRVAADLRFGRPLPAIPFPEPPMLRAGLDAVLRASAEQPELVPADSLTERAATRLYVDSPWSSWEPMGVHRERAVARRVRRADFGEAVYAPSWSDKEIEATGGPLAPAATPALAAEEEEDNLGWVVEYLRDVRRREARGRRRPRSLSDLAREAGVTVRVIERALLRLEDRVEASAVGAHVPLEQPQSAPKAAT